MHANTLELMHDQVRAIYRAVTGKELSEASSAGGAGEETSVGEVPIDELARRFADLDTQARSIPAVMERVPPFSFAPLLDAIEDEGELLLELAVPGIARDDVDVARTGDLLVVSGVRRGERAADGRSYFHAEIPRGPFFRVIKLPPGMFAEPRIEVERGMIFVHLDKKPAETGGVHPPS